MRSLPLLLVAGLLTLLLPEPASAVPSPNYVFTKVVDAGGPVRFRGVPSINDAGVISFQATLDDGTIGVYDGPDVQGTDIVADTDDPYADLSSGTPIDDAGTVLFRATLDAGGEGLFTGDAPLTDTVVDSSGAFDTFDGVPSLAANGLFAFIATLDTGVIGVFTGADAVADLVADSTGAITEITEVEIHSDGTVYYRARLGNTGAGIFTGDDLTADAVIDPAGPFNFVIDFDANASGDVIFRSTIDGEGGTQGLFTGPDPTNDRLLDTSSDDWFTLANVAINDAGQIAFRAGTDSGGESGIFTGSDPVADRVVGTGDGLFGGTILTVNMGSRTSMNSAGQIVFLYNLTAGQPGIGLATPVGTPGDVDGDGVPDESDNCSQRANGTTIPDAGGNSQLDVDNDGIGNVCDGDFNQDDFVGGPDFDVFLQCFNTAVAPGAGPADDSDCGESDMNGDAFVGGPDFDLFLQGFNAAPGPAGCGLGFELVAALGILAALRGRRR